MVWFAVWSVALALLVGGCLTDSTVPCGDLRCPGTMVCTPGGCANPGDVAACDGRQEGDACTTGAAPGACRDGSCRPIACGDGRVDPGEVCDDANIAPGDGCSATCASLEICGNGIVDAIAGEQCDTGIAGLSGDGCASTCQSEFDTWREITPAPIVARAGMAMAYHATREEVVTFGGFTSSAILGDTWIWDKQAWRLRLPPTSPAPRSNYAIAYDSARDRVVMFGGNTFASWLGETWEWDGVTWTERHPPVAPSPRNFAAMTYDPVRQRIVLYGGFGPGSLSDDTWEWDGTTWTERQTTNSPGPQGGYAMAFDGQSGSVLLFTATGQTWQFNGVDWKQVAPPVSPPGRSEGAAIWDPDAGRVVLFGGDQGGTPVSDTWSWDGATWVQDPVGAEAVPAPRFAFGMVHVPAVGVVLFGGYRTSPVGELFGDTWLWNGTQWQEPPVVPASPPARSFGAMAFDARRGRALLFGGVPYSSDVWSLDRTGWTRLDLSGAVPPSRIHNALTYDSVRDRIVLFGGERDRAPYYGDTWELDGSTWIERHPATSPSPRSGASMVYDSRRGRAVLFGGGDGARYFDETWEWDGTLWIERTPASGSPPSRANAMMAFDSSRGRTVMFGGLDDNDYWNDTWEWDGTAWTAVATPVAPEPIAFASMAYDPVAQVVVLVPEGNATWAWDGTSWMRRTPVVAPRSRTGSVMVYDALARYTVIFGGLDFLRNGLADTWSYSHEASGSSAERCGYATEDSDGDGLAGCADPDCWGRCAPLCPPGESCPAHLPRCGDGTCGPVEDPLLCPMDCAP